MVYRTLSDADAAQRFFSDRSPAEKDGSNGVCCGRGALYRMGMVHSKVARSTLHVLRYSTLGLAVSGHGVSAAHESVAVFTSSFSYRGFRCTRRRTR